jgi:hypothetical protein
MAHSNVASCVLSIVGSFSNGLDVFKKLKEKRARRRKSKKTDPVDGEEVRLSRSLRRGQEDIGREYQNNVFTVGDQFAVGDGKDTLTLIMSESCTNPVYSYCPDIVGRDLAEA